MIPSLLKQFIFRKANYWGILLLLSLTTIVLFFVINLMQDYVIRSVEPLINLNFDRCYRLDVQVNENFKDIPRHEKFHQAFSEKLSRIPGIEGVTYHKNNLLNSNTNYSYEREGENSYLVFIGNGFDEVFDLSLEGSCIMESTESNGGPCPAVITRNYAKLLGVIKPSKNAIFSEVFYEGKEEKTFYVVGIIEEDLFLYQSTSPTEIVRSRHPVFVPYSSLGKIWDPGDFSFSYRLKIDADVLQVQKQLKEFVGQDEFDRYIFTSSNDSYVSLREKNVTELIHVSRIVWIPMLLFFIYILITLLGNFLRLLQSRMTEVGIRRALGHTRLQVFVYILFEPVLLYILSLLPVFFVLSMFSNVLEIQNSWFVLLLSSLFVAVLVCLSIIVPMIRVFNIQPIQVIQQE